MGTLTNRREGKTNPRVLVKTISFRFVTASRRGLAAEAICQTTDLFGTGMVVDCRTQLDSLKISELSDLGQTSCHSARCTGGFCPWQPPIITQNILVGCPLRLLRKTFFSKYCKLQNLWFPVIYRCKNGMLGKYGSSTETHNKNWQYEDSWVLLGYVIQKTHESSYCQFLLCVSVLLPYFPNIPFLHL